jgi:hypothetical protein
MNRKNASRWGEPRPTEEAQLWGIIEEPEVNIMSLRRQDYDYLIKLLLIGDSGGFQVPG